MQNEFGSTYAFTGPAPEAALEACHLYSYAALGEPDEHGGLFLRRGIHRLFDVGLLAVDPGATRIDVAPELLRYPSYATLSGTSLQVTTSSKHRKWLSLHWREPRAPLSGG
jgi:hypothetical protein